MFDDLKKLLTKKCGVTNVLIEQNGSELVVEFVPEYAVRDLKPNERCIYVARLYFDFHIYSPIVLIYISADYGVSYRIVKNVESVVKRYFKILKGSE